MTTHSNSYEYCYEYLIKSRQLTWESAEFIDSCFGPIKLEERDVKEENRCQDSYEITRKRTHTTQCYSRTEKKVKRKIYVHLDYNKVVSVRVSLSAIDADEYVHKYSSSDDVSNQPPMSSGSAFKDGPSFVVSTREKRNTCTICQKKFKNKWKLSRHLRNHTGERPFSCPQCEKKFAAKWSLKIHLLIHSGTKKFSCDFCNKPFSTKSELTRHRRIHTGDKPFKCTICNARFSKKCNLNVHKRAAHTGESPYQCEICERKFTHRGHLKRHLLIHSDEKPFACTYANCDKTFRRKDHLLKHTYLHTGEKGTS